LEEKTWCSIRHIHPTRADIEVIHYGRDHLISFAVDSEDVKPLSLPLVLFIDDFGVFRSMTRSAKAFHITPASLPYWERQKPGNNFVLTIAPHKADLDNVISNLEEEMTALADGMNIPINGGEGGAIHVKPFPLILTGDMPQQSDNAGFLRHNATLGCRCCKIPSNDRADLDYDIAANERYHFDTVFLRQEGSFLDGNERKEFFKSHGMNPKASPIARIAPTLDIILSIGLDEPHVLWRGIGRLLYILVITHVLDGLGRVHFIREFQRFRFPPGWQRIQSPLHQKKWTLSESGRAAIVLPLVLRCFGDEAWYDMRILRAFRELGLSHHLLEGCDSEVHGIIKLLSYLAIAISATGSFITKLTPSDVNQLVRRAIEALHLLLDCIELSKTYKRGKKANAKPCSRRRNSTPRSATPRRFEDSEVDADFERFHRKVRAGLGLFVLEHDDVESEEDNLDDLEHEANREDDETSVMDTDSRAASTSQPDQQSSNTPAPKKKRKRLTKLQRHRALPNVHHCLHLENNVIEGGHIMNFSVLPGKHLHGIIKLWAHGSGPANIMAHIFKKMNARQSAILALATSSTLDDANGCIAVIYKKCTELMKSLHPAVGPEESEVESDDEEEEDIITGDITRHTIKLGKMSFNLTPDDMIRLQIRKASHLHLHGITTLRASSASVGTTL
jgi:hypothetical protein